MMNLGTTCSCGEKLYQKDLVENLNVASNGMLQVRGKCPKCDKWIEWVSYKESKLVKKALKEFHEKYGDGSVA